MQATNVAKQAIDQGAIQKQEELCTLIKILQKRKLKTVVEIGTAKGGTFYAWCMLAQADAQLISIDLPLGGLGAKDKPGDIERFESHGRGEQKLFFLRENSQLTATRKKLSEILNGQKIDFLFIDGDHSYKGVKKDWELYSTLVKRDGIIAFHDIVVHPHAPACKVYKLWNSLKSKYKSKEILDPLDTTAWKQWGGIGVIYYTP